MVSTIVSLVTIVWEDSASLSRDFVRLMETVTKTNAVPKETINMECARVSSNLGADFGVH